MATDGNEFRERQRQRAEAKRKRERARKRMIFRLGLILAVILASALLIWLVTSGSNTPGGNTPNTPGISAGNQEATAPTERQDRTTISVTVAGDLNVNAATVGAGLTPYGYNFAHVFRDVAPLLTNADLTVLNFEGNLCGLPYGQDNASAPPEMLEALADIGVDMIQVANSYSIRNGLLGLKSTLEGVRAAGMEPLGAYATEADFREGQGFTIKEVNGIRVAFVAFTKGMDNLGLPVGSEDCVNVLYEDYATTYQTVARDKINSILCSVRSAEPDYTIALLHWGSEYNDELSSTQEEIRELMFAGGVDAIVGTHSHRVQAVEFDREAGTFTAYSLGDFFSDTVEAGTNYSVVLNLQITRDNATGETKLTDYTCTPIYNMKPEESGEATLRLVRTEIAMEGFEIGVYNSISQMLNDSMAYTLERIEYRLKGE
jgi:poly-gamma-glutamate synthesis protein (capsule biosynthesis protein)